MVGPWQTLLLVFLSVACSKQQRQSLDDAECNWRGRIYLAVNDKARKSLHDKMGASAKAAAAVSEFQVNNGTNWRTAQQSLLAACRCSYGSDINTHTEQWDYCTPPPPPPHVSVSQLVLGVCLSQREGRSGY